ncbi:MAG: amidohydrolase [Candidatus Tectomicrobia bacterium]|uniref:Amidohydrolase n=1 Tax=Tectimicrobiota bacterium TaxID=2528274 RepID=A0A938B1Q1_UNCTE|nr:amidohydrolase [Candidatus Tectomicrobia bacterium]
MSMLIHGGHILNSPYTALERVDVLIAGDRIHAVGPTLEVPADVQRLDASGHLLVPGLINAHTHAHNNLFKGMGDNWPLEELLNHGPALNAGRTPEEQYLSAAIGAIEMLKNGCTAAYDLFMAVPAPTSESVEAVVRAYTDVGIRAVVAPAMADLVFYHTMPGLLDLLPPALRSTVEAMQGAPTTGLVQLAEEAVRRWHGAASGRITVGVAPTIPGQCSETFFAECIRLAREYGVGFHTHLAESKVQAIASQQRWGTTLVGHLATVGALGPHFVGAHSVWLTEDDIQQLADAGAAVAHNPASNLKLGCGIAPVREMLEHGLTVGLGTDGSMSSDNQNLFEAMRFAALVGKVRFPHEPTRWIGAQAAWELATRGSARVLGMAADLGTIAPGYKADLVLLRADSAFLRPLNHPLNALVYAETGADVDTVLVDGRVVVHHGQVLTVHEQQLRAQAQAAADRLRVENQNAWTLAEQLSPYIAAACRAAVATPYPVQRYAAS